MREIKFRGKRIDNNEWVYGDLIKDNDKYYIITKIGYVSDENLDFANKYLECFAYEVVPKTVGEYTGLKDDDNKEIYEDDIINTWNKNYRVIYNGYMWALKGFYISCLEIPYDAFSEFSAKKVGNIHDNPKLLEV
ncbi:hypothetical protein QB607_003040 [Clostridium botulinum]|nr:hypothetical protein [Clostridium botulinum]EKS4395714.1 hypothetical protein [Clostridium botulinum]